MAKIQEYDFKGVPTEVRDFKDDVSVVLNFGKYAAAVVTAVPNWPGQKGEFVWYMASGTGRLYVCTSTNVVAWAQVVQFAI